MKLKLEKDFKPISFDIMMPDEIARKRKLEEEKVRSEKERKIKAEKAKAKREELLEWKRKRNYKIALFSSLAVLFLVIIVVVVIILKNKEGKTAKDISTFIDC